MKVVTEEIKIYRKEALKASAAGDSELTYRWRMAADQANNFYLQQRWPQSYCKTSEVEEKNKTPLALNWNYHTNTVQQGAHAILEALKALQNKNTPLVQELVTRASTMQEVTSSYHYWSAQAKKGEYEGFAKKIITSLKTAETYRLKAFEATQQHQLQVAQYWAEAACLLQETARKLTKAQEIYYDRVHNLETDYWRVAAYAAYHAAILQVRVAEVACSSHEQGRLLQYEKAARLADNAMFLKAKAARAYREESEQRALAWSLAGYWMLLAADIKVFLINMSLQKIELPSWEKALVAVEHAATVRKQALEEEATTSQDHSSYLKNLVASLEDTADRWIILAEQELE